MKRKKNIMILVGILLIAYFAYCWPKEIEKTISGCLVSQDKEKVLKHVSMTLKGTYYHSLLRQDRFVGFIEIDGNKYDLRTYEPGSLQTIMSSLENKLKRKSLFTAVMIVKDDFLRGLGGTVFISDDFEQVAGDIKEIDDQYLDQSLMFSGPADTFEEAEKIINDI